MKTKNMGLLISVVFIYGVFVIKRTICYPVLLINRDIVLINVIINVAVTYFSATIFEFIILLIFLKQYKLKFKVFIYIPFIKLITYPFILFGYVFSYSIYFSFISLIFYIFIAEGSTVYIEYIFLLDKFEKSGVWILDKKLKSLTLAGIIVANIIPFSFNLPLMVICPPPLLFYPFKSF